MKKLFHMTKDGIDELKAELAMLIAKRGDIAEAIKTAREQGDLAENAEYHVAKDESGKTESRIAEIEYILQNVEIITKRSGRGKVTLGSTVKLKTSEGKLAEFVVVGTIEADPLEGKISDESPIGRALIGKNVGDEVEINLANQKRKFVVEQIA
ncbi:hypothetical protein A3F37_03260 [Candidatus Saccharibacteria bacterium RIFCSPHIGHO2_12_FULL_41_12]|nr:MAG: hypothetical protein A3F37_03260 [Candidatus Saccharibacteria bacterium RIFCSPHIGHO2_12_FULL_41_12]